MKNNPKHPIGVDLDNTVVSYDAIFFRLALMHGFISQDCPPDKKTIRDRIRFLPDGELKWQHLQGEAYGPRMAEAVPNAGVEDFFSHCRERGIVTYVVSHKTEFANYDPTRTNLRQAALTPTG